ncbi:SCO family protein [Neorhizobium sp. BT27B]|uniref:SCO family protein n=1 Tax=Neorhizobium sp. BT27B TaxID=3142625 RepID=UPI003D2C4568
MLVALAGVVKAQDVDLGGPFTLKAQDGRTFTEKDLAGRPYALFFGFTHCPEVCPTTLGEISVSLSELGTVAEDFRVVFVTVDPERDTPERLKEYLGWFDERIVGLSGTVEEVAVMARAFKATYRKVPTSGGNYTMDHTALIFLMDRHGRFFDKVAYGEHQESQFRKIRDLIAVR